MMRQATYTEIRQALTDALKAHGHRGRLGHKWLLHCQEWDIRMRLHTVTYKPSQVYEVRELPIYVLVEDVSAGDASCAMVVRFPNWFPFPFPKEGESSKYQGDAALQDAALSGDVVVTAEALLRAGGATSEPYGSAVRKLLQMMLHGEAQLLRVRKVMQELLEDGI